MNEMHFLADISQALDDVGVELSPNKQQLLRDRLLEIMGLNYNFLFQE